MRERCHEAYGWAFSRSALLDKYLLRIKQLPRELHFKQPISTDHIKAALRDSSIDIGLRTAVILGFSGMLRAREYVSNRARSFIPESTLLWQDVFIDPVMASRGIHAYKIFLRHSKSDKYNHGREISLLPSGGEFCIVKWLDEYRRQRPGRPGQPFLGKFTKRGHYSYVTRADVSEVLKSHASALGVERSKVSTHSLRIGCAFALANAGVAWDDIVLRGRWSPESGKKMAFLYSRMSYGRVLTVTKALASQFDRPDPLAIPITETGTSIDPLL